MIRTVFPSLTTTALAMALLVPAQLDAARKKVVVRGGPAGGARTAVVVQPNHPIRRSVTRTVILRPARTRVVIGAPLVFVAPVMFAAVAVAALPPRDRLIWEDAETITRKEDWVDCNFGVDRRGDALLLAVDGRAQLDFAEVAFENGQVQVVDFQERTHRSGLYELLNFADGRHVKTVRLLARSETARTKFTVYMRK